MTLAAAGKLSVRMTSSGLDSFVFVTDETLRTLLDFDFDDDGGGGFDSLLTVVLPAGTYFIIANTFSDGLDSGDCTLTLTCPTCADSSAGPLVSAALPTSRCVRVGQTATVFATVLNAGNLSATVCLIAPQTGVIGVSQARP